MSLDLPDPLCLISRSFSGYYVRLLRSQKDEELQIAFSDSEELSKAVKAILGGAGWNWRSAEKVWSIKVDPTVEWKDQTRAEQLYSRIIRQIGQERGLAPSLETSDNQRRV